MQRIKAAFAIAWASLQIVLRIWYALNALFVAGLIALVFWKTWTAPPPTAQQQAVEGSAFGDD